MRASDLLGSEVVDESGRSIGTVRDIRLVQDGPISASFGALFRVQGLVAGPRSLGSRLGFERGNVKGPLMLRVLFRLLHRRAGFVGWDRIRSIEEGRIRIEGRGLDRA
jgi:PRC-barrel domain